MHDNQNVPQQFADFKIVRIVGQGAIGVVYEAFQQSSHDRVALKVFSPWIGLTTNAFSNFRGQIERLTQFKQDGIVRVITCGQSGLRPYYVTQLVDGPCLKKIISRMVDSLGKPRRAMLTDSNRLIGDKCPDWALDWWLGDTLDANSSPAKSKGSMPQRFDRAALFIAQAAEVLSSAHAQGLVHGDLKPSNLLLTRDMTVCISDFALARLLETPGWVVGGDFCVSPVYSPPEYFQGSRSPVDPRADVYALGAVLYELLTLKPPYTGGRDSIISQILRDDPPPPRSVDHKVPRKLEAICCKAMERKPSNRYQNASQLADDLKSYATQRPVSVRKIGFVQSRVRWSVRHPVNALVLVSCLSLAGITGKVAFDVHQSYSIQYADRTREATFRGLMQSMIGDIPATQQTTAELRNCGVAPGLLALMLGQAQLVAGNIEDAVSELKQAQKQRPESEALMVLLAEAYSKSGQLQECFEIEKKLATAGPTDIVDRLFHANWLAQKDTPRAIEVIGEIRQNADRHSDLLARVYLVLANSRLFGDTDDLQYFDSVLTITQGLGEPYALYRLLQFRAMKDADRVLQSTKTEEYEYYNVFPKDILRTIDKEHPDSVTAARAWTWQALSLDDSEMRMQAIRRSIDLYQRNSMPVPADVLRSFILELLLNDRVQEAEEQLTSLSKTGAADLEFLTAVTLAQRDGNVSRAAEELAHLRLNGGRQTLIRPVGYLILGMTEKALESFHAIPKSSEQFGIEDHWHLQLLRFAIDELTAEQIVAEAKQPRRSNFWLSEAHFFVGMKQLAAGNRHEAKLHLEECLRCGVFTSPEYLYARTILEMWKRTPNWPLWIAVAEEDQPK